MNLSDPASAVGLTLAVAGDPAGDFLLAFEVDTGEDDDEASSPLSPEGRIPGRLARVDREGRLAWVHDTVEMGYAHVHLAPSAPDGRVLFADATRHGAAWIDPRTGASAAAAFDPFDATGVVVGLDGSVVVLKQWDDDHPILLRRFAPDGAPLPVWREWQREPPDVYPEWEGLYAGGVVAPEPNARLASGWDGSLFFWTNEALARIESDGRVPWVVKFPPEIVTRVYAVGADRAGVAYVLFEHTSSRAGDTDDRHLLRVTPNGQWQVWLGPRVNGSPSIVGPYDEHMAVMPDGTLLVACMTSLRVITPDGRTAWRSADAVARDALVLETSR